ncbi:MAG: hypothetical protein IJU60_03810 [Acholeplasmatales bacterium]|nr:hypothetical protein [Acholeplasmatales bacterium]
MEISNNFKIVKYEQDNISIDVRYDIENKTIWLTQSEIALVFETTKNNITIRLKSIIKNALSNKCDLPLLVKEELVKNRLTKLYSLDAIKELSKRSKSASGYDFIKWADNLINYGFDNQMSDLSPYKANNYEIVTFENDEVMLDIRVSPTEDTVWLTQSEIAILFNVTKQNVSFHIQKILDEKELDKNRVVKFYLTTEFEKYRPLK